jgi:dihydroxyacetone kinase-like protein
MSFEIGGEQAQAEGIDVSMVVIADDVAVENSTWTQGRRGLGTALFAEKVLRSSWQSKDAKAPIFRIAQYGKEGDLFKILPALTAEAKKRLGK